MNDQKKEFLQSIAAVLRENGVDACLVIYEIDHCICYTVVSCANADAERVEGLNAISDYLNQQLSQ